jgi:hypothetical protein
MSETRLSKVIDLAYERLRTRINSGRILIDNEASLQLQLGSLLKDVGELFEDTRDDLFAIELEKPVQLDGAKFGKSGTQKAKIDIFCSYTHRVSGEIETCAIELKYFKCANHREPNNRYDVFADILNLENYGQFAQQGYLIVATDHEHYVRHEGYSEDTADFDFRHGQTYTAGTLATYRTNGYKGPIRLRDSYRFEWDTEVDGIHFLKLQVRPASSPTAPPSAALHGNPQLKRSVERTICDL